MTNDDISNDPQDQALMQQIQVMLMDHSIQKYLFFENKCGDLIADHIPDYIRDGEEKQFLEKNFNEFPKPDLDEDGLIDTFDDLYDPTELRKRQQVLINGLH